VRLPPALKRSGLFEAGQSYSNCAIQISAQQPSIEIDVLNLRSAGDLTIFRPMAFIEISPILTFSTEIF